jgi:hypothetical protein
MYDVAEILHNLNEQHEHAIAVLGGAYFAITCVHGDNIDMDQFVMFLPDVINKAQFFGWHEGIVGALNRFCHICLVDPALIEAYIGMRFEEVASL